MYSFTYFQFYNSNKNKTYTLKQVAYPLIHKLISKQQEE
jgi:hypothetical protein